MKSRSNLFIAAAVLSLAALFGSSVYAAENIFNIVPNEAAGVVVVNRLGQTDGKIARLCDQLQCPVPQQFTRISALKDSAAGIDPSGSAALIVMPGKGKFDLDTAVIAIPVTDFKQFLTQFTTDNPQDTIIKAKSTKDQMECLIASKGGFALMASPQAKDALNAVLNSKQSLATAVEPWSDWLKLADVNAIITNAGLMRISNQEIAQMEDARKFVAQGPKQLEPFGVILDAAIKQLASSEKEIKMASVSIVLSDTGGVKLYHNMLFEPHGKISEFFESLGKNRNNPMAGLPKGPFVMAFSGVLPKKLAELAGDFAAEVIDTWPTSHALGERQAKYMAKIHQKMLADIRGISLMFSTPTAGVPLVNTSYSSIWVDDSRQFLSDYGKEVRAALELAKKEAGTKKTGSQGATTFEWSGDPSMAKVSVRDITVGNVSAIELTIDFSRLLSEQGSSPQAQIVKQLYGSTGITTTYIAAADPYTVVFTHGGQEALKAAINAVKNSGASLAGDQGVAQANKKLLPGGQWVGYWNPRGVVDFINSAFQKSASNGAQKQLPRFPSTLPVGMTIKANATGLVKELYIPEDVVKAIGSYQTMLRKAAQQTGQTGQTNETWETY